MTHHPAKLVTIICEALAREPLKRLLAEVGARGYTLFTVEGEGSQGRRAAEMPEFANIQVEIVLQPAAAEKLLARLEEEFFSKFAMVAYESDIRVLRREKF
jgi:nitrogen regulatory protein PII